MGLDRGRLRGVATRIFQAGLDAADPAVAVGRSLRLEEDAVEIGPAGTPVRRLDRDEVRQVVVVGAGKAAAAMGRAVEAALGRLVAGGLLVTTRGQGIDLDRVRVVEASHPLPDRSGEVAAAEVARLVSAAGEGDLVLVLLSGGGSALLPLPAEGVTLADKVRTTDLLLASGADIRELNAVRKHLSAIKGGRLSALAPPARLVALVLSDVVGDPLDAIASGPTVPDPTTFGEALAVLERHGLGGRAPTAVVARLEAGARGEIEETPSEGHPCFARAETHLVGTNAMALEACAAQAGREGLRPLLLTSTLQGEASTAGRVLAAIGLEARRASRPVEPPACIVAGGETTVTVRGDGLGGRNQELALAAALDIAGAPAMAVFSAGTDGRDGPTDAAGAIAFPDTVVRGRAAGLDAKAFLARNDSYRFFDPLGDLVRTGPTGTNVMDIHLVLVE